MLFSLISRKKQSPALPSPVGVASVCGAVACRIFMGTILDVLGPRLGTAATVLLFVPAVFCMSLVESSAGFTAARLFIGCSLCMFVCTQFWVGTMFNVRIVGTANAIAAGWGNSGGGACNLLMPLIYEVS
jgi:MFS transporter, NNP family, nitrate/nitrite transporter